MKINPYVSFKGDCEAAFNFYERSLGGRLGPLFRYAGSPMADQVPPDWQDKVMHGSVIVGELQLMGADVMPLGYVEPKGFSLSLQMDNPAEAERIFDALSKDGSITLPLEKTFWAERFGMVVDRFGIPWLINCEQPKPGS